MRKTITTKSGGMILQQVWHTDKPILPMGYKQQGSVNYIPFSPDLFGQQSKVANSSPLISESAS